MWFRRIGLGNDLANNLGTAIDLPRRTGKMGADLAALLVKEIGFRPFERPLEAAVFGIASVDLYTVRHEFEHRRRTRGWCYGGLVGTSGKDTRADQNRRHDKTGDIFHVASTAWAAGPRHRLPTASALQSRH